MTDHKANKRGARVLKTKKGAQREQKTRKSAFVKPFSGEFYTRYLSKGYDAVTSLTGWRKHLQEHSLDGIKPGILLDVGCGTGFIMNNARAKGFQVFGIDPSAGMIKLACKQYGFTAKEIFQTTSDKLPFADNTFDIVLASGSMEYVVNIEDTAKEMIRVLKRGGIMRIIDHATPKKKSALSPFFYLFTQASGHLIHDYEFYFAKFATLVNHKTLGRGGYMQLFDFKKR